MVSQGSWFLHVFPNSDQDKLEDLLNCQAVNHEDLLNCKAVNLEDRWNSVISLSG